MVVALSWLAVVEFRIHILQALRTSATNHLSPTSTFNHERAIAQGFEVMLKSVIPENEEIVDTTNHTAAKQPVYLRHEVPL